MSAAAGYRNNATGALGDVGTNGEYFSSSPLSASVAQAGALWFNSGTVNPLSNPNRANGRSVRCVQASAYGCFQMEGHSDPGEESDADSSPGFGMIFCFRRK